MLPLLLRGLRVVVVVPAAATAAVAASAVRAGEREVGTPLIG